MAKQQSKRKRAEDKPSPSAKGNVTPIQVAVIVERYLVGSNYTITLSAFRSEAGDLLSKTKGKEVPKGLLALGDILEEYISLKEQRVMLDQEKRRVDKALHGIQDVMRAYHSAAMPALLQPPPPPLASPQAAMATPTTETPTISPCNLINKSPQGHLMSVSDTVNCSQVSFPLKASGSSNFSTPIPRSSSDNKRKALKSASKIPPAPKKSHVQLKKPCIQRPLSSSTVAGKLPLSGAACVDLTRENTVNPPAIHSASINNDMNDSPDQGSSVVKNLFKQQPDSGAIASSPKTPPQDYTMKSGKSISSGNMPLQISDGASSRDNTSTNCSIFSSQTIIVSPLKSPGYYAVQRSYQVTSPFKSSPRKLAKRDYVKGKLHFGEQDTSIDSEKPVTAGSCSTSLTDGETPETFDYDLPDLDFFKGDFSFSEFLSGIDLDFEGVPSICQPECTPTDPIQESKKNTNNECSEANQALPGSCQSTITRVLSEKDISIQGSNSVTTVRSIMKCIKSSSPAKTRLNSLNEQTQQQKHS